MSNQSFEALKEYIGERVSQYRNSKKPKLSQAQLAKIVGSSRQHIGAIERGETIPSIDLLALISLALKVPLKAFFPSHLTTEKPSTSTELVDRMVNDVVQLNHKDRRVAALILRTLCENPEV